MLQLYHFTNLSSYFKGNHLTTFKMSLPFKIRHNLWELLISCWLFFLKPKLHHGHSLTKVTQNKPEQKGAYVDHIIVVSMETNTTLSTSVVKQQTGAELFFFYVPHVLPCTKMYVSVSVTDISGSVHTRLSRASFNQLSFLCLFILLPPSSQLNTINLAIYFNFISHSISF